MKSQRTLSMPETREIIRSTRAADRIAAARAWLAAAPAAAEVLVVASTREAADDLVRELAAARGAVAGIHRLTLGRLAGLLAAEVTATSGLAPATELAAQAIAARAVFHFAPSGKLKHFAPVADRPGFAEALARTIAELRLNNIGAKALARIGDSGAELALLLARFDEELAAAKLIDRAGMLAIAADAVRGNPLPRFAGIPALFLDVAVESIRERDLIAALAERAQRFLATVPAGDERTAAMLASALDVAIGDAPSAGAPGASSLASLQQYLFGGEPPNRSLDETVTVTSAPGEMHECVEIARRISREAAAGVRFDRIAVLLRDPVRYVPYLQEALARAAIPAHFSREARRPRPGGRALLALLACKAEDLSARRYAEYLSLAQVPADDSPADSAAAHPGDELIALSLGRDLDASPAAATGDDLEAAERPTRAPWRWERIIVDAAVIGSADRWKRRLDGLENELRRRQLASKDDDGRRIGLDRQIADLEDLKRIALGHIAMLAALPQSATWGEWLDHLRAIVATAIRDRATVLATLAELEPMAPVGPVTLDEVRLVLAERLARLEDRPEPRRYGAVMVAPPHRARGMSFDVVIVPGLAERVFPQKLIEDPILPDTARAAIDPALKRTEDRVTIERLALRIAAGAAEQRVMFSYPRIDIDQGRPRVPSFYALELLRAAEGRLPGFDELARRAACEQAIRLGWPAPARPEDAIDEAEFDLAVLDKLVDADPETTRGAARYLLDANEYLGRALRTRARRWLRRWTPADGLVDPEPPALAALGRHQLSARPYSPTSLQHFAACPYRFLLQAIHRLEPREEPEAIEIIDPLTRGGLFHEVQYEILTALRAADLLPLSAETLARAETMLDERLDSVATRWREELAPAIERVWQDGIEEIRADLREWLRRDADDPARWTPERFELAFGLVDRGQADPASSANPIPLDGGLQVRGSIDLVERAPGRALRVTDHKTGKVRAERSFVIGGGKILQPVIYALAAEHMLGEPVETGRLYYCTATGGYEDRVATIDAEARGSLREFGAILSGALSSGFLPAAPDGGECQWCDYRRVCGPYEERRTSLKPDSRLKDLRKLRAMR
ncbi:MAG: PD-(D/E)XK nuclease family protein [Candidatus Binataceae bacterium]